MLYDNPVVRGRLNPRHGILLVLRITKRRLRALLSRDAGYVDALAVVQKRLLRIFRPLQLEQVVEFSFLG